MEIVPSVVLFTAARTRAGVPEKSSPGIVAFFLFYHLFAVKKRRLATFDAKTKADRSPLRGSCPLESWFLIFTGMRNQKVQRNHPPISLLQPETTVLPKLCSLNPN
jgi:hypothetical protein